MFVDEIFARRIQSHFEDESGSTYFIVVLIRLDL